MAPFSLPTLVQLVLLLAAGASAFQPADGANRLDPRHYVKNSYYIEIDASSITLAKRGLTPFAALNRTLAAVANRGVRYNVRQRFLDLPEVFHGASIEVMDGTSMESLAAIEGVKRVWPVQKLYRTNPLSSDGGDSFAPAAINSSILLSTVGSVPPASAYEGETYYAHIQTGVASLHNAGYLGEGVKIAVFDDGVDYTNPILGGCFGEGCHISFGYAFVNDDYTGEEVSVSSPDPYSGCSAHGTHVTGIIGALANELGFSGVAPAATLGHYRILGCSGTTADDIIVAALLRAYNDGVQVASLSLGSGIGWLDLTPSQVIIDYLAGQGMHIAVAGGNERSEGLFFTDYPAATVQGTAVGSIDPLYQPAYNAQLSNGVKIPYIGPTPLNQSGTYNIYLTQTSSTTSGDACSALPDTTPDLSNSVVVVLRGGCDFTVKQANVADAGGKIVLIYNSKGSLSLPQLNAGTTGLDAVAGMRYEEGVQLLNYYLADPTITISFPFGKLVPYLLDNVSGGTVSYQSNYGPTNELYMYPTVVAPGSNILSTVPGGVALMRGSSMATPYHAGSIALLLSARRTDALTPAQAKDLLMTTSTLTPSGYGASTLEPIISQGAGIIDVTRAIAARTIISPGQILLNDTQYLNNVQEITIENRNTFPVAYKLSASNALGISTFNNGASQDGIPSLTPAENSIAAVRVAYSRRQLTIPARSSAKVTVTITPPNLSASDRDKFPFYSGFLVISGEGLESGRKRNQAFTVPYFGLAARMVDLPVLDTTNQVLGPYLPFVAKGESIQTGPMTYSRSNPPIAYFRLASGSRRLTVDLVAGNIDFQATVPAVTNPVARMAKRSTDELVKRATPTLYADVPTLGRLYTPQYAPARDYVLNYSPYGYTDYEISFNGTYTNAAGRTVNVPNGTQYRYLVRALKITADASLSGSYDSWLSPPFSFTGSGTQ
ncbi:hypothetical protein JCM10207_005930 [Rhodosporidiobolus poonsookiae]